MATLRDYNVKKPALEREIAKLSRAIKTFKAPDVVDESSFQALESRVTELESIGAQATVVQGSGYYTSQTGTNSGGWQI